MTSNDKTSSQAGLSSFVDGRAKSLPSVPAPGQPGSRFNPVVVTREEQAARRAAADVKKEAPANVVPAKSLLIKPPPGVGPKSSSEQQIAEAEELSVAGAAVGGFAEGVAQGAVEALDPEVSTHRKKVVMRPEHLAGLAALSDHQNEGLENGGNDYSR